MLADKMSFDYTLLYSIQFICLPIEGPQGDT